MIALILIVNKVNLTDSAKNTSNRVFSNNQIELSRIQLYEFPMTFQKRKKSHDFPRLFVQFPMIPMTLWTTCEDISGNTS